VQFQYNRFLRYSRSVREAAKSAKSKQRSLEAALSKERKQWRKRESEVQKELEEHKVELDHVKKKLRKWDDRKDGIRHYMSVVVEMSRCE
jgi:septal ring factor EnvC (AmiA/AmiB activator)